MSEVVIYSAQVCPYAQRSRMMLIEKGVDSELVEIDLTDKPDWFLKISPYAKVPVIKHGETVVWESAIINEYLEEVFPTPPLLPRDPAQRARARIFIQYCDGKFLPTAYKLLMEQDLSRRTELFQEAESQLRFLERESIGSGDGPYWLGPDLSLVDIAYYPFFERFCVFRHYRGLDIPEDCPRLRTWLDLMQRRKSAKATGNGEDFYIPRYSQYADGTADGVSARDFRRGTAN